VKVVKKVKDKMALFGTFSQEMALSEGCSMGFGGFDGRMLFSFFHLDKQARRLSACHGKDHQAIKPTDITTSSSLSAPQACKKLPMAFVKSQNRTSTENDKMEAAGDAL
jgi:hypothetical protein